LFVAHARLFCFSFPHVRACVRACVGLLCVAPSALQSIVTFRHADADAQHAAAVTALSFCTDPLLEPFLLSGSDAGAIAVWSLGERRLQTLLPSAHSGPVSGERRACACPCGTCCLVVHVPT
jgi:predicted Na+-dependent transporter